MLQKKMTVFGHINTAFMASHIVSAASSESGIKGTLQHHVLFPCCKIEKIHKELRLSRNENHKLNAFYSSLQCTTTITFML